jgi:hypothetical protein
MTLKLLSWNPRNLQRAYLKFYFVGTRPLRNMNYLSKICMEEGNLSDFSSGGDLNHCNSVGKCAERRTDKRVHSHPCTYVDRWMSGRMVR